MLGRQSAGGHHRRSCEHGWEFVHIAIDDCTRLAYVEVLDNEKATTAIAFLRRAVAFYRRYGITVERLITDNGAAYRSTVHAIACRMLAIRHLRTRPYRPQTNGKAERFIRTLVGGWAYGRSTATAPNAPLPLTAGSTTTTITDDTAPSATSPRSLASTSEPTCSGLTPSAQPGSPSIPPTRLIRSERHSHGGDRVGVQHQAFRPAFGSGRRVPGRLGNETTLTRQSPPRESSCACG